MILDGTNLESMILDDVEVQLWLHDDVEVFSAGKEVTYVIDTDNTVVEKVKKGNSALSPTTFTPARSGWEFLGWREDTVASGDVLTSKVVESTSFTLYAVFKKNVTMHYYNGSANRSSSGGTCYYNNGNQVNAKFTMKQASLDGWACWGWATSSDATATSHYSNGDTLEIASDFTIYGRYAQTIYLWYNGNGGSGSVSEQSDLRFFNSGNYYNPTFTLKSNGFSRADSAINQSLGGDPNGGSASESYVFNGWNLGAVGATVTLSSDTIAYAQWRKSKLYIHFSNKHDGGTFNLPWSADSWTTIDLTGLSTMSVTTSTWTRDGCDEPTWNIQLGGSTVMTIGGNETKSVSIGGRGSCQLRLSHPEVWYNDGYSHGQSTVYLTFT